MMRVAAKDMSKVVRGSHWVAKRARGLRPGTLAAAGGGPSGSRCGFMRMGGSLRRRWQDDGEEMLVMVSGSACGYSRSRRGTSETRRRHGDHGAEEAEANPRGIIRSTGASDSTIGVGPGREAWMKNNSNEKRTLSDPPVGTRVEGDEGSGGEVAVAVVVLVCMVLRTCPTCPWGGGGGGCG